MRISRESVAVVIPVYKPGMTELEQLSLSRCVTVLGDYPLILVGPRSLEIGAYQSLARKSTVLPFDDRFFVSLSAYSRLLLTPEFYEAFCRYSHILIYQLDAFVFRDRLLDWCNRNFDYIGAPIRDKRGRWLGVGNGGFSLRNVRSSLDVLRSNNDDDPVKYWEYICRTFEKPLGRALRYHRKLARHLGMATSLSWFLRRYIRRGYPEDLFWGLHAVRYYPAFKVAPVGEAIRFSVEAGLEETYVHFTHEPPFGCHRSWFLEMLHRFLYSQEDARSPYERLVWDLARVAGLERGRSPLRNLA
jgi:hypothetical protein